MIGQQIINGLMLGSVYAMVAVALTLSIGVLKFLNFSIPGLFMIGGMATWALTRSGMPWPLAAGAALLAGAIASLVVERFTWRWMRMADEFVPLVSSMAFLILFENLVVGGMGNIWGAIAGGLIIGLAEVFSIDLFGADFVDISVYGLLLLILVVRPTGLFGSASVGARV